MEEVKELQKRINQIDYRLRVLEKFLDTNGLIKMYKGEKSDLDAIRLEVLRDMRKEIKDLQIKFDKDMGLNFYHGNK